MRRPEVSGQLSHYDGRSAGERVTASATARQQLLPAGHVEASGRLAGRFIEEMGFDDTPWVAVRHGDDHIHLTVSRVDWNGQLLSDQYDYARARAAADLLEQEHGLVRARDRFRDDGPGPEPMSIMAKVGPTEPVTNTPRRRPAFPTPAASSTSCVSAYGSQCRAAYR